jgi:HD-GYP domain-containing protein (c-di-GMP phosphodiesterase class II)
MDLIGNPFINLLPQQHATHYMEEYQSILEDGERTLRLETELYQTNNLYLPVEIHAKRFVWNENRYVQILIRDISERKLAEQQIKKAYDALQESLEETIVGWGRTLEKRDMETHGHTQRVTEITVAMAKKLGFTDDQLVQIRRGAALHDLGKIGIPDRILLKPAPLDEEEWEIMRKHPTYAYEMISSIFFLLPASIIPLYHHERWDGSGYPQGLKGEEIPLEARIFAIVDVWDALSSDRPYRKAWKRDKIIQYIRQNAGVLFDPSIVEIFLETIEQIEANLL